MRMKGAGSAVAIVASLVILSIAFHAHATSPPNLSMPNMSGQCLNNGATFVTALTASNMTSVQSWQLNLTFTTGKLAVMNYTLGSAFNGLSTDSTSRNSTSTGYYLLGFTFQGAAGPYTTTFPVTLVTFTWKALVYHPTVFFHIVTSAQNGLFGTMLLDPNQNSQSYTTTDGFLGCQLRPSP